MPPPKRTRSSLFSSGTTTPASRYSDVSAEKIQTKLKDANSLSVSTSLTVSSARSRYRIKAPLSKGGLDSFEQQFPSIALWVSSKDGKSDISKDGSKDGGYVTHALTPTSADLSGAGKASTIRRHRVSVVNTTPQWVPVVSQLLRGPLWRYGPAIIFHKPLLQLPPNLGPKYAVDPSEPEKKLSIDLSVIRKKLEKGKYTKLTEIDRDVKSMFAQAYALVENRESNLGLLTRATEIYYEQQMAGCGLAAIVRQEAEDLARATRNSILSDSQYMTDII